MSYIRQYWILQFPNDKPDHWRPFRQSQTYERDYANLYFCYHQPGSVTRRVYKSIWFDSKEAAEWHRSDLGMPYLKAIPIEIRIG